MRDLEREAEELNLNAQATISAYASSNNGPSSMAVLAQPLIPSSFEAAASSTAAADQLLNNDSETKKKKATHVMYSGPRFKFTRWVTKFPNNILAIVLIYLLVVPFGVQVKDMVINQVRVVYGWI